MISVPTASLTSHVKRNPGMWHCQHCGVEKKPNAYLRQRKYCSMKCHGASQVGKANPAFIHGHRANKPNRRRPVSPTQEQIGQIRAWIAKKNELGTASAAAERIGVSLYALYRYSSSKFWDGKVAP